MARNNTGAAAYLQGYGKRLPQRYFRTALNGRCGEGFGLSQRRAPGIPNEGEFDNRPNDAYNCHSMAISSLRRTWQLDPNSRPRSVWFLSSIRLEHVSASTLNVQKARREEDTGRRARACGLRIIGDTVHDGNTKAEHGIKE
jgi:hypothetical protein